MMRLRMLLVVCLILTGFQAALAEPMVTKANDGGTVTFWLETSLNRVYPRSEPGDKTELEILTARNRQVSFQACLRNMRDKGLQVNCSVEGGDGLQIQVRRVGYVPMHNFTADVPASELAGVGHIPGLVPDPLYPEPDALFGPFSTQSFWVTVKVPKDIEPGIRELTVKLKSSVLPQPAEMKVKVDVKELVLQPRKDFPVTHWWLPDAIYDYYKTGIYGERFWDLLQAFLENMISHGSDVIMVPIFYCRREVVERPPQMLDITVDENGDYQFDWTRTRRFVKLAKEVGFKYFEWSHLWIYKVDSTSYSVENPTRMYTWKDGKAELLWPIDTPATGEVYRKFLSQFLPEFNKFLDEEDILENSFFHLSDEPGPEEQDVANYKAARALIRELAPWIKSMDAMSDIRYGKLGLTDIPVPLANAAQEYIDAGIPHWVYYCCVE